MKWFNIHSAIKWTFQWMTEDVSCYKYTEVNKYVVSKKALSFTQNGYKLFICVAAPSCLQKLENLEYRT